MSQTPWWQSAVIYQIYPKSFQDSAARGTGDLKGIMARLDYLKTLGVDALWLTPVYVSPQVDNGYDIADYLAIDPAYGTMADFEALLAAAHARDIRIVMDIVVNHTSTEHAWFKSALGDKNSPYRDYYIWRDPVDGGVPNNWQSKFGGSAWELDPATGQYYLHLFAREQADLNWENPAVRAEVKNIIHFWAKKGVDGFRLDVINLISKDQAFPNDEIGDGRRFYTDGPRIHEFLQDVSCDVFAPVGAMTVGEMSSTSLEHCQRYGALDGSELSMVFNFHHLKVDYPNGDKWTKAPFDFLELKRIFNHWQSGMHGKGWSALFWCNHDQPRIVSRFGDEGEHRVVAAKMLASTLHGLQGTPLHLSGGGDRHDQPRLSAHQRLSGCGEPQHLRHQAGGRDERGRDPRHSRRQVPRQLAHADAVERSGQCRFHPRNALAQACRQLSRDQCRGGAGRPELGVLALSGSHRPSQGAPHLHSGGIIRSC